MAAPPPAPARTTRSSTAGRTARRSTSPRPAGSAASPAARPSGSSKTNERVALGRGLTGAQTALQAPAGPRRNVGGAATVARAALEDPLDPAHTGEPALEVVVEGLIAWANDDQQMDVGEGLRR